MEYRRGEKGTKEPPAIATAERVAFSDLGVLRGFVSVCGLHDGTDFGGRPSGLSGVALAGHVTVSWVALDPFLVYLVYAVGRR
jgi:hypothetical protein